MLPTVFFTVLRVFTDTGWVTHHNRTNTLLDALLDHTSREGVEVVGAPSRAPLVQPTGFVGVRTVTELTGKRLVNCAEGEYDN